MILPCTRQVGETFQSSALLRHLTRRASEGLLDGGVGFIDGYRHPLDEYLAGSRA